MHVRLFTLRFSGSLGLIDDRPLRAFLEQVELLALREHYFCADQVQHVACLVFWRPLARDAQATPGPPGPIAGSDGRGGAQAVGQADGSSTQALRITANATPRSSIDASALTEVEQATFERLRVWRRDMAQREGVPPYIICTNKQLLALVGLRPDSLNGLQSIEGFGRSKVERYGTELLMLVAPTKVSHALSGEPAGAGTGPEGPGPESADNRIPR